MVEQISEYYKEKRYDKVYIIINKENRKTALLRGCNCKKKLTLSYAKYLYTSHYQCDVPIGEEIDHINGDKTDDRIENLQKISKAYNIRKDRKGQEMVMRKCPVCGVEFLFPSRNLSTRPNPCCSRRCGGIKSHWKKEK